jgi:hypothetical protein
MKVSANEFNPTFIIEDSFPDLDTALSPNSGKKNKVPTSKETEARKKAALEFLPTKGKPESFFHHKGEHVPPNKEQLKFVWTHYP